MKLIGLIRSAETREIEVEATSYAEARAAIEAQVPEGWQVLSFRRRAGPVESAHSDATLASLGGIGAQRRMVTRQRRDPTGEAPALPHPQRVGVDGPGGFGACSADSGGDAVGKSIG